MAMGEQSRFLSAPLLAVLVFILVVHGGWWLSGDQIVLHGGFSDGDSYLRLLRVERLIDTADWFDVLIPDANAPYGTTVHWTRLFDMVLLVLAAPMIPFLGSAKALFWAGVIVSPIIHLFAAVALAWAVVPLLGRAGALFAAAMTAAQAGVLAFSLIGRADHHMMFILFTCLSAGFVIRILMDQDGWRQKAFAAGLVFAAGIWEGPEFLVFTLLCLAVLGLPWLTTGESKACEKNLSVVQGLLGGLIASVLIERGVSGFLDVGYDRISIVHICFAGLLFIFWSAVARAGQRLTMAGLPWRVALAVVGIVGVALILVALFPNVLANPLNDADPAILPIYASISEYQATSDASQMLIYFGAALFAVPWLLRCVWKTWDKPQRWPWLLVACALVLYLALGLNWLRWCLYAALFLAIVIADLLRSTDGRINASFSFPVRVPVKLVAFLVISIGPMIVGAALLYGAKTPGERDAVNNDPCPVRELSAFLSETPLLDSGQTIAASANFGPEIIYRTDHKVLATVHHRNAAGILDGYRIMNGVDESAVNSIVDTRQVDLLLLCPATSNDDYFLIDSSERSIYRRLQNGDPPAWLHAVELPIGLRNKFRLFEVME